MISHKPLGWRRAVVIVGLAMFAITTAACRRDTEPPSGREAVAAAVGDTLPFRARLSGGFAPSKRGPTRAAVDRAAQLSPDARIAIAHLEKRATDSPTPAALADLGVAYLIQGDIDRAIATIADAASQDPKPAPWSDLSAAYLAKAERAPQRRVEYLARALEAAERSLKIAKSNDALFNRALARDGLAPYTGAPAPWPEFASLEKDEAWRNAAAMEANDDRPRDDVRDRWEARRKELPARLKSGDVGYINETVRLFPEAAIEFVERNLLTDVTALPGAVLLAAAIRQVTRDSMVHDAADALRVHGAALAKAHQLYASSFASFNANDLVGARQQFLAASRQFARFDAPYRAWADFYLAVIDWRENSFAASQQKLARLERQARSAGYDVLLARVLMQRGLAHNRQWQLTEGLAAFREAAARFESTSQRESAVGMYSNIADALRMLGDSQESWAYIARTLEDLPHVRRPARRYLLLYNASLFASRQHLYEAALLFQDATVREAGAASTDMLTEALVQRALVNVRRGEQQRARADLDQAAQQVAAATSTAFRDYMQAELAIVRAQLPGVDAVAQLQQAITFFGRTDPGRVPGLFLLVARTPEARAARSIAEAALQSGIERLETQQAALGDEALRISFFDESWALFHDMVALQLTAGDSTTAFDYAERSRARALLATTQGSRSSSRTRTLAEIQPQLPASVALLHYSVLADRVAAWTITRSATTFIERRIDERELGRLVEQHRAAIAGRRESPVNDRLYDLLLTPATSSIPPAAVVVLIPDGALQQLAFATLRSPSTRRYLIEDHAVMVSPSASFFIDARAAASGRAQGPPASALLVGNPAASQGPALPGAEAEVAMASKVYARHETLIGRNATKQRFLAAAAEFDVVHFGGHAIANPEFPLLSRLVFADDSAGEQSLFAHEIARLRFPRTRVVVLAACSTAAGAVSRGEGVVSVARPFLGGGVPLVIASQWDVDDRATQQLTPAFHRELSKAGDPIRALQAAQLGLLRSGDAMLASPDSWGAFVAVGTTAAGADR